MYKYDGDFYNYINEGAKNSARGLLPVLLEALPTPIESVMDVGCGAGAWLDVWKSYGTQITGLDGSYVSGEQLLINSDEFIATDLTEHFQLGRTFDLVQSLEVAEHLPETAAANFVACLCLHSPLVLFSAATPGQGGENHINEQPHNYWRALFREKGYTMYDPVRAEVAGISQIKSWYRYNTFLYVNENCPAALLAALAGYRVADGEEPVDITPLSYRLRTRLISALPSRVSTMLAILKKTLFVSILRVRGKWRQ